MLSPAPASLQPLLLLLLPQLLRVFGAEFAFLLPDNDKMCFYEDLEKNVTFDILFQVITGGHYDVDYFVTDPQNNVLYKGEKKMYDRVSNTTTMKGAYQVCFSNEFSSFTNKMVFMAFNHADEPSLMPGMTRTTALTQLETSCVSIHENLKVVTASQLWYKLREAQDRWQAEILHQRVAYWSMGQAVLLFVIGIGQVILLRSFFTEKKGGSLAATT